MSSNKVFRRSISSFLLVVLAAIASRQLSAAPRLAPDATDAFAEAIVNQIRLQAEQKMRAEQSAIPAPAEAPLISILDDRWELRLAPAFAEPIVGESPAPDASAMMPAVCFAPGTSDEVVEAFYSLRKGYELDFYRLGMRWGVTATNSGGGLQQGDATTITWSIIPDGTNIPGGSQQGAGEPASPSNLIAFLNGIYGNQATWLALFNQIFDRWSQLTGLRYTYQPTDDGAGFPGSQGQLNIRGDVRIGGHFIDGNSNILAYNFFPNTGDMVIDTGDNFYSNPSGTANNSLGFRNVLSHEHGHGLGFNHVCPSEGKKLMEPFVNLGFDGPQIDDRLAGNRGYGDRFEFPANNTAATATSLGAPLANGQTSVTELSIDDNADVDFYRFNTTAANKTATIILQPVGETYLEGPQNSGGSCPAGVNFNALTINDLGVELIDSNGATVLGSANVNPAGQPETITGIPLPSGTGPYYIRVFGGNVDNVQLYRVSIEITNTFPMPIIQANGSSLVAENCPPANSVIDPGETVTVNYTLRNIGSAATGNLVATLQSSASVTSPSASQNYGSIAPNTSVTRAFTFTAAGACGASATATLQLQDGTTDLGLVSFGFTLGSFTVSNSTFSNSASIGIPAVGTAVPYPSTMNVAGLTNPVTKVTVTLNNLTHSWLADLDVLLVGPGGQKLMLMSDAGTEAPGGTPANNVTLTFSDTAPTGISQGASLVSGTYTPTDFGADDNLPGPAPARPYGTALSAFNGINPNGNWMLYVADDASGDSGNIAGGWSLTITTAAPVCCDLPELRILSIERLLNGNISVLGSGVPNASHTLQLSDDPVFTVSDPTVMVLGNAMGLLQYEDAAGLPQRFYRYRYP